MRHRSCPECGRHVPWSRLWVHNKVFATWACLGCGAVLTFRRKRRRLVTLLAPGAMAVTLAAVAPLANSFVLASAAALVSYTLAWLLDGVAVVDGSVPLPTQANGRHTA